MSDKQPQDEKNNSTFPQYGYEEVLYPIRFIFKRRYATHDNGVCPYCKSKIFYKYKMNAALRFCITCNNYFTM
jgi:DNA-directed RNA polymerase subunit RPC12/RpoP